MSAPRTQQLEEQVWDALKRGEARQAIEACEQLNQQFPEYASGWHAASQVALKLGNVTMALDAVREALRMRPDYTPWLIQEARCLAKLGNVEEVASLLDRLTDTQINSPYENSALGMLLTEVGRREEALDYYQRAAMLQPNDARHYFNIATLQRTLGRLGEAERNFTRTIELDPDDYEAYKLRSELRTWTADNNHIDELKRVLATGAGDGRGRANLCYAIAKESEDTGDWKETFDYLEKGARARRDSMRYNPSRDIETMAAIRETFSRGMFERTQPGDQSREPVFVLGMPRTGTTLVERILSNHSDVFAAGELPNFAVELMKLVRKEGGDRQFTRDDLVRLSAQIDFAALGANYIRSTRPATGYTRMFVDKLPLNYLYVGLIHLALPNAKIINVRRDPLDTCFAVYKTLFADAYPFSYDLEELARYYVAYHQLMEHWNSVLPGVIYRVAYEELVGNVEKESRDLVNHCDLDWQQQCLRFYESNAASTTASAVQVRQPVYTSSVGRWQKFRKQLQPVIAILREAGIVDADGKPN